MISGTLSEWKNLKSYLSEVFSRAFAYLAAHGGDLETGRHEIEGSAFYVNVEEGMTRPASDRKFEAHARYIDIQLLLEGDERQDFITHANHLTPTDDRLERDDIAFYPNLDPAETVTMKPGDFAIYFPGERHAPNLAVTGPAMHKKAVFKIRADLAEL